MQHKKKLTKVLLLENDVMTGVKEVEKTMTWGEFFTFSVEYAQIKRQNCKKLKIEKKMQLRRS